MGTPGHRVTKWAACSWVSLGGSTKTETQVGQQGDSMDLAHDGKWGEANGECG